MNLITRPVYMISAVTRAFTLGVCSAVILMEYSDTPDVSKGEVHNYEVRNETKDPCRGIDHSDTDSCADWRVFRISDVWGHDSI